MNPFRARRFLAATILVSLLAFPPIVSAQTVGEPPPAAAETQIQLISRLFEELETRMAKQIQEGLQGLDQQSQPGAIPEQIEQLAKQMNVLAEQPTSEVLTEIGIRITTLDQTFQGRQDSIKNDLATLLQKPEASAFAFPWLAPGFSVLAFLAAATAAFLTFQKSAPATATSVNRAPVALHREEDPSSALFKTISERLDTLQSTVLSPPPPAIDLSGIESQLTGLALLSEALKNLERRVENLPSTDPAQIAAIEQTLATLLQRLPEPAPPEQTPPPRKGLEEFLPPPLRHGGRLASEGERLEAGATQANNAARCLAAALIEWEATTPTSRDSTLIAAQTHAVGRRLFPYLRQLHGEDRDAAIEGIQAWTKAFKTILEEKTPSLKLVAVYPEDRFDTDRMEAVRSVSTARLNISFPLSWLILERTDASERVLHRAEVITA